ncbi:MAG TPA: hypothetical protein VL595_01085 [Pseudonocardia sp.]|jgi:hypothetical protein|nr:hypothetical protein [Pseudonocardia sp.]
MNTYQAPTYAELNAVLDQARRPSRTPTPVSDAQLLGLQHRWTTMLSARLDQAIEDAEYGRLAEATTEAWHQLAVEQPVLRGVLDSGLGRSEALTDALDGELRILALAAGLVGIDTPEDRAVVVGREFRDAFTGTPAPLRRVA